MMTGTMIQSNTPERAARHVDGGRHVAAATSRARAARLVAPGGEWIHDARVLQTSISRLRRAHVSPPSTESTWPVT